ncbi:MAG: hypothetical protein DME89_00400 [Verrucomicrobia bacterium]|nr:MAG: hypothetical protein DME89_00400 [Verrucomicrobiota bacterium]
MAHDRFTTEVDLVGYRCFPIKFGKRRVKNEVTSPPYLETEIDVRKRFGECRIESANFLKNLAAHQQACARNSAVVANHLQLTVYAGIFRWKAAKSRLRNSINAKDDPGVLDCAVGIH